jgi:hypothetical protein
VKKISACGLCPPRREDMSILKKIVLVLFSCMIIVSFTACKKEGPAESVGKKIDEAVEKTGDKIKDSAEKAGDKIEEAGDKVKESTKK